METGAPDWTGLNWKVETTSRFNLLYPGGKILFKDDFESGVFSWESGGVGTETVGLTTSKPFSGAAAAQLKTGNVINDTAFMERNMGYVAGGKMGLQFAYTARCDDDFSIEIQVYFWEGTKVYYGRIKREWADSEWYYYDSTGEWAVLPGATQYLYYDASCYNRIKVVFDFTKGTYFTLYSNNEKYDMSNLAMNPWFGGTSEYLYVKLLVTTKSANNAYFVIDDLMVTEE